MGARHDHVGALHSPSGERIPKHQRMMLQNSADGQHAPYHQHLLLKVGFFDFANIGFCVQKASFHRRRQRSRGNGERSEDSKRRRLPQRHRAQKVVLKDPPLRRRRRRPRVATLGSHTPTGERIPKHQQMMIRKSVPRQPDVRQQDEGAREHHQRRRPDLGRRRGRVVDFDIVVQEAAPDDRAKTKRPSHSSGEDHFHSRLENARKRKRGELRRRRRREVQATARTRPAPAEFFELGLGLANPSYDKLLSGEQLTVGEIRNLCQDAESVFDSQPNILRHLFRPITIVGDVHANFDDLMLIFQLQGFPSRDRKFLFLGDYIDRGTASLRVILTLFALVVEFPESVFCLRGNHETRHVAERYGFRDEVRQEFGHGTPESQAVFDAILETTFCMPVAAVVDSVIFCVHGGLSPQLTLDDIGQMNRKIEIPKAGLYANLVWADPDDEMGFNDSHRGAGVHFGADESQDFLARNDLSLIVRAHQYVVEGFSLRHENRVVTVFSSSNYCGRGNKGAVLFLAVDGMISCVQYTEGREVDRANIVKLEG